MHNLKIDSVSLARMWNIWNFQTLSTVEQIIQFFLTVSVIAEHTYDYDPATSLLGVYVKEIPVYMHQNMRTKENGNVQIKPPASIKDELCNSF